MNTLLLLDGTAEIYRSYHAFKEMRNSKGEPTGAAFGFVLALRRLLDDEAPTHAAVAFDLPGPTIRHAAFEAYKATRKPPPAEMVIQIPIVKELTSAIGMHAVEVPGFEADDVIATLSSTAVAAGFAVTVVSRDKDLLQVIEPGVTLIDHKKGSERLDEAAAERRIGIPPARIPDLLGLMGDSSDNIPGVEGVGEKIAKRLIVEHGTIDAIYEDLDKLPNARVRTKLEAQRAQAFLSRELATVRRDVPLAIGVDELRVRQPAAQRLREIYERLDFKSLAANLPSGPARQAALFDDE